MSLKFGLNSPLRYKCLVTDILLRADFDRRERVRTMGCEHVGEKLPYTQSIYVAIG